LEEPLIQYDLVESKTLTDMETSDLREFHQNLWERWQRQNLSYLSGEEEGEV
jgi:hypothetical protein